MEVLEIFTSFQGEGVFVGTPATFLRLAGCNLNCKWCDTDLTEKFEMSCEEVKDIILTQMTQNNVNTLVITGGEPTLQIEELNQLINSLPNSLHIQFETNGLKEIEIASNIDYVISPKINKEEIFLRNLNFTNAFFKFVITSQEDIDEIIYLKDKYNYKRTIWLQPEFSKAPQITDLIVKNFNKLDNIKISAQTHKYLNQR